ncbi:hypothetical protein G7K_1056-t1 [Saitoella complicata NRRL Y-17804]|uniref:Uncharacterized protein n=1 Tax=Saitoella complicata (strain BCRC 22490 / CBS 7301 / JCM 7358 / NBRC 10748 / NRRL Y-17804) TaxID=698492 RepID=A0A0E9NAJ6_SAICN|nr:hypothetical protein G7K_1056-t1 [Saitoella complicata NRRL Y-17804]
MGGTLECAAEFGNLITQQRDKEVNRDVRIDLLGWEICCGIDLARLGRVGVQPVVHINAFLRSHAHGRRGKTWVHVLQSQRNLEASDATCSILTAERPDNALWILLLLSGLAGFTIAIGEAYNYPWSWLGDYGTSSPVLLSRPSRRVMQRSYSHGQRNASGSTRRALASLKEVCRIATRYRGRSTGDVTILPFTHNLKEQLPRLLTSAIGLARSMNIYVRTAEI